MTDLYSLVWWKLLQIRLFACIYSSEVYYNRCSMRTITLYDTSNSSLLSEIKTNVSPAILIPYFDVDTKLLFLTGKVVQNYCWRYYKSWLSAAIMQGDISILVYEYVKSESPYLFAVPPFSCGSPHQVNGELASKCSSGYVIVLCHLGCRLLTQEIMWCY